VHENAVKNTFIQQAQQDRYVAQKMRRMLIISAVLSIFCKRVYQRVEKGSLILQTHTDNATTHFSRFFFSAELFFRGIGGEQAEHCPYATKEVSRWKNPWRARVPMMKNSMGVSQNIRRPI